jgi:hypothetical protein
MNIKASLCAIIFSFFLAGCSKNDQGTPGPTDTIGTTGTTGSVGATGSLTAGVYAVGMIPSATDLKERATIWINGTATTLSNSYSQAFGLAIQNGNIYVAGNNTLNSKSVACYWKNNNVVYLTGGTESSSVAMAIVTTPTDVYIAGSIVQPNLYSTPAYWKNGVANTLALPQGALGAAATSIVVKGSDVYIGGSYISENRSKACYWKNGAIIDISGTAVTSYVYGIAVEGTDVYTAGIKNGSDYFAVASQNGSTTVLSNFYPASSATCITVSGSDVYIGGHGFAISFVDPIQMYWLNGIAVVMANSITTRCIAVQANIVYMGGDYYVNVPNKPTKTYAAYTKNGVITQLSQIESSTVRSLVVIP